MDTTDTSEVIIDINAMIIKLNKKLTDFEKRLTGKFDNADISWSDNQKM